MLKLSAGKAGLVGLALAALPAAAPAMGPDAAACRGGGQPAILVNVSGFKAQSGRVRVNVYADRARFLQPGQQVRRIDLPVTGSRALPVCIRLPRAGTYAVAVRHDLQGNGSDWGDGGGFSRNPRLSLASLRPDFRDVALDVGDGVAVANVVLNYRFGLSVRPVRS